MDKQLCLNLAAGVPLPVKASMQSFVRLIHPGECFLHPTEDIEVLRRKNTFCVLFISLLGLLLCLFQMKVGFCLGESEAADAVRHHTVVVTHSLILGLSMVAMVCFTFVKTYLMWSKQVCTLL